MARENSIRLCVPRRTALSLLRHAVVHGVQKSPLNKVSELCEGLADMIEVRPIRIEHPPNILENDKFRMVSLYRREESGEPVTRIMLAVLPAAHAERLAGRTSNDYIRLLDQVLVRLQTICWHSPSRFLL